VPQEFEIALTKERLDVFPPAREKIVKANDLMPVIQQALAEMRANETSATGDYDSHKCLTMFLNSNRR
jgi:hypothetical protein